MSPLLTLCAAVALIAQAPLDTAVIVGTRDTIAYRIVVRSDGAASISSATNGFKSFTLPDETVARFFAALVASRSDNWTSGPCTKPGPPETVRVKWDGWVSGDVTCPPHEVDAEYDAMRLNNSVMEIVVFAGPPATTPCSELPPELRPANCPGS
jgi:hypothetical protein